MTDTSVSSANTKLADENGARQILGTANNTLSALTAAGIQLNAIETTFMQAIDWSQLKSAILAAYDQGQTPQLRTAVGAPGVSGPDQNGVITLSGAIPAAGP